MTDLADLPRPSAPASPSSVAPAAETPGTLAHGVRLASVVSSGRDLPAYSSPSNIICRPVGTDVAAEARERWMLELAVRRPTNLSSHP